MPNVTNIQTTSNSNKCPHGLPVGTCPICNAKMMGGGQTRENTIQKNKDEWSWMKCYIEGQMMKGQKTREEFEKQIIQNRIKIDNRANISDFIQNIKNIIDKTQASLPHPLNTVFFKITNSIMTPLLNIISKIPNTINKIQEFIQNTRSLILSSMEKLTALFGEIKNFVERKILDKFKKLAKKILRFFIWEDNDENLKEDEEIEKFKSRELRKIQSAIKTIKRKEENDNKAN